MSKQAPPVLMQLCQSCMSTRPATTPTRKKSQGGHRGCVHAPSLCALSCPTLRPYGLQPPRLLCPWDSPAKSTGVGLLCPPPGDLPNPGIEPRSPAFLADSLLPEAPGDLGPTLIQYDFLLTSFHLQKPYFQVRPHLQVLGVRISAYVWGETAGG